MAVGYVYLMTNGRDYKIGLTASEPEERKRQLQTGSSEHISLIAYTLCKDMSGLENKLHTLFSSKRKAGEWFELCEDNLHHVYSVFKQESINLDMSLIPEILSKEIDVLMRIDGKRLSKGENTLYDKNYIHIPDYKKIVMNYMHEEEKNIEQKRKDRYEALLKEEEEEYRLEELLREDAKRIAYGEKPLHTFEYKELEGWKSDLEGEVAQLRGEEKELRREEEEEELRREEEEEEKALLDNKLIELKEEFSGIKNKQRKERAEEIIHKLGLFEKEHIIKPSGEKRRIENTYNSYYNSRKREYEKRLKYILIDEKNASSLKKELKSKNDKARLEAKKRFEANKAKEAEKRAGTHRTTGSWKNYLSKSILHLFQDDEQTNTVERISLNDPKIERDRIVYVITFLEREKNIIKPPKYEPYFEGSFKDHLELNRQKAKRLYPRASRIDAEVKYFARAIGEDGERTAKLLRDQAIEQYNKYVLEHGEVPSDYVG